MPKAHDDILLHLGGLDELIQVIYHGFYRFVVLSNVDDQNWTLHLGLLGPEGRRWRGVWDSTHVVDRKLSSKLLDAFADRVVEHFVKGELCVDDWNPDKGDEIKLTFGSGSNDPVQVRLMELSAQDAASHAAKMFFDIALQSRTRGCRLNPPSIELPPPSRTVYAGPSSSAATVPPASSSKDQEEIKALKAELANTRKKQKPPQAVEPPAKPAAARPPKGASLANPNKKARKYQALEFED